MTRPRLLLHRWVSRHPMLSTAFLAMGVLVAVVEPAAARIGANHNQTLISDEG